MAEMTEAESNAKMVRLTCDAWDFIKRMLDTGELKLSTYSDIREYAIARDLLDATFAQARSGSHGAT